MNRVCVNEVEDASALLVQYRAEIEQLKQKLVDGSGASSVALQARLQEEAEKTRELEEQTRKAMQDKQEKQLKLDQLQRLVLVSSRVKHDPSLLIQVEKNMQDVVAGRRRAESVIAETIQMEGRIGM